MEPSGPGGADAGYWIGLSLVPEVGPVTARRLLSCLGSPRNIFHAPVGELLSVPGMTREKAGRIHSFSRWPEVEKSLKTVERKGISVVGLYDDRYPEALREVDDAPTVLFLRGEYRKDDRFGVAVVGSRRNTTYGEAVTRRITSRLAEAGLTIVSGMARGIDTLAHRSALDAGGRTVAVLGAGPDVAYPAENRGLMDEIAASGCVISEFLPGTRPDREHFPRRNRLISGLSLGVLVVEAALNSGSLITASYALEQNKDVFAVPGNITARSSEGANRLLRQGARIVLDADDVLAELAPALKGYLRPEARLAACLSSAEEAVCRLLSPEPRQIDGIAREASMPVSRLLELLLGLELKGVVRQTEGKKFYLVWGGSSDTKTA
ncbi:MAG: DNA-processing protein DprA [Thermodesulfovibrionales bacterium]